MDSVKLLYLNWPHQFNHDYTPQMKQKEAILQRKTSIHHYLFSVKSIFAHKNKGLGTAISSDRQGNS